MLDERDCELSRGHSHVESAQRTLPRRHRLRAGRLQVDSNEATDAILLCGYLSVAICRRH